MKYLLITISFILIWAYTVGFGFFNEYMLNKNIYSKVKIIKSTTDSRHLTSVIYIDLKGDTVAMDYLTYEELRNLH